MSTKRNNPFRNSYLSMVLICCVALSIVYSYVLYTSNNAIQKQNNQKKTELLQEDFENQLQLISDTVLKISINVSYQPFRFEETIYREKELLEDFERYQDYFALTEECFLYYGGDKIYSSTGYTRSVQAYLSEFSEDERVKMQEALSGVGEILIGTREKENVLVTSKGMHFLIPFRVSAKEGRRSAVFLITVKNEDLRERFEVVSGGIRGNISIYREDILLYSIQDKPCEQGQKNVLTASTTDGLYTICYLPERESYMQSSMLLSQIVLVLSNIILLFLIANVYAEKSYQPLQDIFQKYYKQLSMKETVQGENALEGINHIMDILLKGTEIASQQIAQNQNILRRQVLQMLLEGTFSQELFSYLDKLQIKLPGPYFFVISISFQYEAGVSEEFLSGLLDELEGISNEEGEYVYTVVDYDKKQYSIICSIVYEERKEELTEYICEVVQSFEFKPIDGIGNTYQNLSRVSASWLESIDNIHNKVNKKNKEASYEFTYDTKELHRISVAIVNGNAIEALKALNCYVEEVRKGGMSLLMQQYIVMDFVTEMTRLARKQHIGLTNQNISVVISAKNIHDFETAARELIYELCKKILQMREPSKEEDSYRIYEYVNDHFTEYDLSIEKVALDMNVSTMMVRQAVLKYTGKMYKDYLISRRIEYAKLLLTEEELTVAKVCQRVGYSNVSYFIRLFKEATGVTPANYKLENNKRNEGCE